MRTYLPRIADRELDARLAAAGAVLIEGPRACGKTETGRNRAASEVLLDVDANAQRMATLDPRLLLDGAEPRLIDEWQVAPTVWNHVRREVDRRPGKGHFILTGSSVPADDETRHTGAGRISRLRLRTLSWYETGLSEGRVSLGDLLQGTFSSCAIEEVSVADIATRLCRGGWPADVELSLSSCLTARVDYLEEIRRTDISRLDGVTRDPANVGRVLRSLARNVSTQASLSTIAADAGGSDRPLRPDTVRTYLEALRRLMVYEEQPAWSPSLRSRSVLRGAPKRHFVDPSLAVAAIGADPERILAELEYMGLLFESLVYRDLAIYANASDAQMFHYRDNTMEVDTVVQNRRGDWCAFEVKLGTGQADAAAAALLKLHDRVDTKIVGEPKALGVIVGTGAYAYRRPDGILVVPLAALGP